MSRITGYVIIAAVVLLGIIAPIIGISTMTAHKHEKLER